MSKPTYPREKLIGRDGESVVSLYWRAKELSYLNIGDTGALASIRLTPALARRIIRALDGIAK